MSLFLLALAVVITWNSLLRVIRSRFIDPVDLATLSIAYYSFPLSFAALYFSNDLPFAFLNEVASDHLTAIKAAWTAILACLSLQSGAAIATYREKNRRTTESTFRVAPSDQTKAAAAALALGALIAIGIVLFGDAFFEGYAVASTQEYALAGNALVYASIELIGLTLAYSVLVQRRISAARISAIFLVLAGALLLIGLARGKRLEIVAAFLPAGIVLAALWRPLTRWHIRIGATGAVTVCLAAVAAYRVDDFAAPAPSILTFYAFAEGLYAGHALPGIISGVASGAVGLEYGQRFVDALLAFVPRFFWPQKDAYLYSIRAGLEDVSPLGATSFLGEIYLQAGMVGVALSFVLMGYAFRASTLAVRRFDWKATNNRLPASLISYLIFVAIFIPHFRDGVIPAVKISLQAAAYFSILIGLHLTPQLTFGISARSPNNPAR